MIKILNWCNGVFFKATSLNVLLTLILIFLIAPLAAQDTPATLLKKGIQLFTDGDFPKARDTLKECLKQKQKLKAKEIETAYQYLAEALLALELEDQAISAVEELLSNYPQYKPDTELDRPEYINLVEKVRKGMAADTEDVGEEGDEEDIISGTGDDTESTQGKKRKIPKWLWFVGGGVVAVGIGALVYALTRDKEIIEKDEDLPGPPELPVSSH